MSDADAVPPWQQRFRAVRVSLPGWARDAPERCLYLSNATGTTEVYAWDRSTDRHRQATDRSNGTAIAALEPDGSALWWFDDHDGDEFGVWRRQPFDGGPDQPAAPGVPAGYPAGLALGRHLHAVGCAGADGTQVFLLTPGAPPRRVYHHEQDAHVVALSRDGSLLAISHSEHGDALKPALRVLRVEDGATVADLWDGPGKGLAGVDFSPVPGDQRLLAVHERTGARLPLLWDPTTGTETPVEPGLAGDFEPDFYPDGSALLLHREHHGRSELYRWAPDTGAVRLDLPAGTVSAATARPDGEVELSWSSGAEPPQLRTVSGTVVLAPPGAPPPGSLPVDDVWVDGPGGPVHALLATPDGPGPHPAVFLVHGGPMWHDRDAFDPARAAWLDHGLAVVHVNYRGSTGYGAAWQDAINGRPGLTELADVAAVRDHLVTAGVVDRDRLVLAGGSWGGYLTLLGLGTQPDAWAVGVAAVPVADYVTAYADEMAPLQATDRSLFGGSPEEVPETYRTASPISYVERLRAPVLVLAGVNDPRCPIRQIENYLDRLRAHGRAHEVYRFEAGHGSLVVEERIRQMAVELDFVGRHLPPGR